MSKLSMLDEVITSKDENYYVNRCSSSNKIKREEHGQDIVTFYQVEDKIVELQERIVPNGEDDIDYELSEVIIHNNLPF